MTSALLSLVLDRIAQVPDATIRHTETQRFEKAERNALVADGVLCEIAFDEENDELPRPSRFPPGPNLLVRRTAHGIFGVAVEGEFHEPFPLEDDDVRLYRIDERRILNRLCPENGISGPLVDNAPGLYHLGSCELSAGARAEVHASLRNPNTASFIAVCARLRDPSGGATFVLTPTAVPLQIEQRREIEAMGVRVVPLDRHLADGRWLLPPWNDAADSAAAHPAGPAFRRVLREVGNGTVSREEYDAVVAAPHVYDLVIDGPARLAWSIGPKGKRRETLTDREVSILAEYIEAGQLMRPSVTAAGRKSDAPEKLFTVARRKVDRTLPGKKEYRAFPMSRDYEKGQGRTTGVVLMYRFDPPAGFTYRVFLPV